MNSVDNSQSNLLKEMQEIQENMYKEHKKNTFFKKSQKLEIAKTVSQNFELSILLQKSIFILQENKIYIDYTILKMFIYEGIYENVITHLLELYKICIQTYGNYIVYINLNGFTISAAERHKKAIIMFSRRCLNEPNMNYGDLMEKTYILNTPSTINILMQMINPFFPKNFLNRVEYYKKDESENIMNQWKMSIIKSEIIT